MTKGADNNKQVLEEVPRGEGGPAGKVVLSEDVVATIAGLAAREVPGIHALGKSRIIPFGDKPSRGVAAAVGQREAALDLEVVIKHGCDIREVAGEVRKRVAEQVEKMTGRKVIEVNLSVVGVNFGTEPMPAEPSPPPRVR